MFSPPHFGHMFGHLSSSRDTVTLRDIAQGTGKSLESKSGDARAPWSSDKHLLKTPGPSCQEEERPGGSWAGVKLLSGTVLHLKQATFLGISLPALAKLQR